MSAAIDDSSSWDFSPVYHLLEHFSEDYSTGRDLRIGEAGGDSSSSLEQPVTPPHVIDSYHQAPETGLGNFDKLWEYLRQPLDVPPPVVLSAGPSPPKIVKWRDEIDGADLADNDDAGDSLSGMTKQQRKKANRNARKAIAHIVGDNKSFPQSSENESEKENKGYKKERTPVSDSRSVIHDLLYGSSLTPAASPSAYRVLKRPQPATDIAGRKGIWDSSELASTALADAAARKSSLMTMLNDRFPDERQYLKNISILPHTNLDANATPEGIHVFIDASNITIGFHDALKAARSLPSTHRMRRQPLSFHSLSPLLTRGRPTSKLILVGSDNFPAIAEAKAIGYETNILDRVHKAKELTPRQRHFSRSQGNSGQSAGSGSETGLVYADAKWVEQAVDEILHLKMMESIVDATEPGTMVLASGDAAEAEYSGGFLKMVERALGKGWRVEVACFRLNTSGMYRRKEFREKWGQKFKIVELDDFVEVLMGVE